MGGKDIIVAIKLKDQLTAQLAKVNTGMKGLRSQWQGYAKVSAVATGAAVAMGLALKKVTTSAVDYGVAVDKMAKQIGISTEEWTKMAYAAEQEHLSTQALGLGLLQLSKNMSFAKDGLQTYTREFDRMGIKVTDARGQLRPMQDVLVEMGDYMKDESIPSTQRTATALTLLGRAGKEGIPFLKLTREELAGLYVEAERVGVVISEETAAAFKKFDDVMTTMKGAMRGVTISFAEQLLPILESVTRATTVLIEKFTALPAPMKKVAAVGGITATALTGLIGVTAGVAGGLGLMANQAVEFAKKFPVIIRGLQAAAIAMKTFSMSMLAAMPIIVAGAAAIYLLHKTFKEYNTMKDAQEAAEDTEEFKRQAMEAATNVEKYTQRLNELAEAEVTTGKEVDRLKERLALNVHKYEVMARKVGINTDAMDKYKAALAEMAEPAEKSIELQRLLAQAMGDTRKLGLMAIEDHITKMKEENATEAEMLRARQTMTAKLEKEITDTKTQAYTERLDKRQELKDKLLEIFGTEEEQAKARIDAEIEGLRELGASHAEMLRVRETLEAEFAERQLEEKRRLKEEERAHWRERAEIVQGFYDEHMRLTEGDTAFQLEELKAQYAIYNTYIEDKVALNEWYAAKEKEIMGGSTDAIVELGSEMYSEMKAMSVDMLASGMEGMLGLEENWLESFENIAKNFSTMIGKMIIRTLALQAIKMIFKGPLAFLPMKEGGIVGRPEGIPAQEGLMVYKPTPIIAGERGPEMIAPLDRFAEVVREELNRAGGGGGGVTVNIDKAWDGASIADYFRGEGGKALLQATKEGHQVIHSRGIRT